MPSLVTIRYDTIGEFNVDVTDTTSSSPPNLAKLAFEFWDDL